MLAGMKTIVPFVILLVTSPCFAQRSAVSSAEIRAAINQAAQLECERIEKDIAEAERQLKQPSRNKNETRQKIFIKKQIAEAKKYIAELRTGKRIPKLVELNPFKLQVGTIGYLDRQSFIVDESLDIGVIVIARNAIQSRRSNAAVEYGSRAMYSNIARNQRQQNGMGEPPLWYNYSPPFLLINERGARGERINIDREKTWIVSEYKGALALMPMPMPNKDQE
jgi:hypothetical protein